MKNTLSFTLLIMFWMLIWSCEKAVDLKLKDNEPKYVIEGQITNEKGVCKVLISKTKNVGDDNQFKGVSGASVKIENNGITTLLPEVSPGVYQVNTIDGTPGQTYQLTVTIDNQVFKAVSTMPELVELKDFYIKAGDYGKKTTVGTIKYKDPLAVKNYYWFRKYVNGVVQKDYDVFNDEFTPGQDVSQRLDFTNETKDDANDIKHGDNFVVSMSCIDQDVYIYLNSLYNANGNGQTGPAPANPISNISGGALGYFSAHTIQSKTITVP